MIGCQLLYRLILKIPCLLLTEYVKRRDRILNTIARFPIFFKHLYFLFSLRIIILLQHFLTPQYLLLVIYSQFHFHSLPVL